jgi:hypothetical protein
MAFPARFSAVFTAATRRKTSQSSIDSNNLFHHTAHLSDQFLRVAPIFLNILILMIAPKIFIVNVQGNCMELGRLADFCPVGVFKNADRIPLYQQPHRSCRVNHHYAVNMLAGAGIYPIAGDGESVRVADMDQLNVSFIRQADLVVGRLVPTDKYKAHRCLPLEKKGASLP